MVGIVKFIWDFVVQDANRLGSSTLCIQKVHGLPPTNLEFGCVPSDPPSPRLCQLEVLHESTASRLPPIRNNIFIMTHSVVLLFQITLVGSELVSSKFLNCLPDASYSASIGNTDIASILDTYSMVEIVNLLSIHEFM